MKTFSKPNIKVTVFDNLHARLCSGRMFSVNVKAPLFIAQVRVN